MFLKGMQRLVVRLNRNDDNDNDYLLVNSQKSSVMSKSRVFQLQERLRCACRSSYFLSF